MGVLCYHHAGMRMPLADWAECPSCHFPCSGTQFVKILAVEQHCPMCNQQVAVDTVRRVADPLSQLKKQ